MRRTSRGASALVIGLLLGCAKTSAPGASRQNDDEAWNDEPHTFCWSDDDCRLSCIKPGDCCGEPPFCSHARHYDDHEKIQATRTNCAGFDYTTCPAKDHTVPAEVAIPTCRLGRCVAKKVERQEPPAPIDVSGYDRACSTDDDCIVVQTQPCAKCGCASEPIAAREEQKLVQAMSAVECPPYDPWPDVECGSCMPSTPACEAGRCVAR